MKSQNLLTSALIGTLMITSNSVLAEEKKEKLGFKGNGEFGLSTSTGNTETDTLFASLKLSYTRAHDEFKSKIESNYQSENNVTTQERYLVDSQYNRFYTTEKDYYSFMGARFEQNKLEGLNLDSIYSLGLGKTLHKTESLQLDGEMGLGLQVTQYTAEFGDTTEQQAVIRGKLDLAYKINDNVDFEQDVTVISGPDQTKTDANTAVKVKLAEQMRMKVGFKVRHNSAPADDAKKTDTQTLITLVYDF